MKRSPNGARRAAGRGGARGGGGGVPRPDDPTPIDYSREVSDDAAIERLFIGWFMFERPLDDGRLPAELAVERFALRRTKDALASVRGARWVFTVVETVLRNSVVLEIEDEHFEVRHREWARTFARGAAVAAHLMPLGRGVWLTGPGWVQLGISIGPNVREHLQDFQMSAFDVERLLQRRTDAPSVPAPSPEPSARVLAQAVDRMTKLAWRLRSPALALSIDEWTALVQPYLEGVEFSQYVDDVMECASGAPSLDQMNEVLGLAQQIWNATPQRDRAGLTAAELWRLGGVGRDRPSR